MKLIDTHVSGLHNGKITVEFRGEDGELVSVQMAEGGDLNHHGTVERAKNVIERLMKSVGEADHSRDNASDLPTGTEDAPSSDVGAPTGLRYLSPSRSS
ncbi:MAG: hypothetical protein KGI75_04080 [Rhizobiaceae bacterium]|nr:hypothetical protein [Rhizobiaceae bacterium]